MSDFLAVAAAFIGKAFVWLGKNPMILGLILLAVAILALWIQHGWLQSARANLKTERAAFATERATLRAEQGAFATSEARRAAENRAAASAIGDAETACSARIAAARRSGSLIRQIVETPVVQDPQSHCPVRGVIGSDQLRRAAGLP